MKSKLLRSIISIFIMGSSLMLMSLFFALIIRPELWLKMHGIDILLIIFLSYGFINCIILWIFTKIYYNKIKNDFGEKVRNLVEESSFIVLNYILFMFSFLFCFASIWILIFVIHMKWTLYYWLKTRG